MCTNKKILLEAHFVKGELLAGERVLVDHLIDICRSALRVEVAEGLPIVCDASTDLHPCNILACTLMHMPRL
jgi:hypothetical protein